MPRQETGRYFRPTSVPSADEPQRQPFRPVPISVVELATMLLIIGAKVAFLALTWLPIPCIVTITIPLVSVATEATYFEVAPSQRHEFAAGGAPPL